MKNRLRRQDRPVTSVLLTTSTFPRSPDDPVAAPFVLDLARHLSRHVRVTVLAPAAPGVPHRTHWSEVLVVRHQYFSPARYQVLTTGQGILASMRENPLGKIQLPLLVASQCVALPRVVAREGIQLVNSHWIVPQGLNAAIWRRSLGFTHVATAHSADVAFLKRSRLGGTLARFILNRTDGFLPVSSQLGDELEQVAGRPLDRRVIPMGVSTSQFNPSVEPASIREQSTDQILLFVGKFVPKKGLPTLLQSAASLLDRGLSVKVVLVGGGPLEGEMRALAHSLGIEATVNFMGWCPNRELPAFYAAADVVCIPSIRDERGETEGMPVVVQEALAAGKMIVASRVGGIPDVIEEGDNGWLVAPSDPDELTNLLEHALTVDEPRRERIEAAARRTALDQSWERLAERYLAAFDQAHWKAKEGPPGAFR